MGIAWTLAFRVNLWLSLLLLLLAPLDILSYKLLYQELISLSGRTFPAFQEIAALQQQAAPPRPAPLGSKVLHWLSIMAKAAAAVLALADYILQGYDSLRLALYLIILPLFFSSLGELVYGNLCRKDLVNSINYLKEVQDRKELNSCQ